MLATITTHRAQPRWSARRTVGACLPWLLALSTAAAPGCMTVIGRRHLRAGVAELQARLEARRDVEREQTRELAELTRAFTDAETRWAAAGSGTLMAAARRESEIAALAARADHLAEEVRRRSREQTDEDGRFETRAAALEQGEAALAERVGLSIPDDKEELWRQAGKLLASGEGDRGRHYYQVFIDRFPQDSRAAQAYLAIGRSYGDASRYSSAATSYQDLLAHYPNAPEVPEALWQLSRAFEGLSFCKDARALLQRLVDRFPHSSEAAAASKELRHLKTPLVGADCVS